MMWWDIKQEKKPPEMKYFWLILIENERHRKPTRNEDWPRGIVFQSLISSNISFKNFKRLLQNCSNRDNLPAHLRIFFTRLWGFWCRIGVFRCRRIFGLGAGGYWFWRGMLRAGGGIWGFSGGIGICSGVHELCTRLYYVLRCLGIRAGTDECWGKDDG